MITLMLIVFLASWTLFPACLLISKSELERKKSWIQFNQILSNAIKYWIILLVVMEIVGTIVYFIVK